MSSGGAARRVAAGSPAGAVDQPGPLQVEQDLHEEPIRDAVLVGDVRQTHRLRVGVPGGQLQHRDARVFGFGGEKHGFSVPGSHVQVHEAKTIGDLATFNREPGIY